MMLNEKSSIDAVAILGVLNDARTAFDATRPTTKRNAKRADVQTEAPVYAVTEAEDAIRDFEIVAVGEALIALGEEIQAECARRMDEAYRLAIEVFYKAEELSRDPEHAHLIEHVAALRKAHVAQYGKDIPPRCE